jgi:multiple RNA-binding domain-containing protein 1
LALAETQIVSETKEFFEAHGIVLDSFGKKERSETVILVKNIPYGTTEEELRGLFGKFGELGRVLIPPAKTMAVVEFLEPSEGRRAFQSLAYRRFKDSLIYLEKAPIGIFKDPTAGVALKDKKADSNDSVGGTSAGILDLKTTAGKNNDQDDEDLSAVATLFVKNLNFETTPESLRKVFSGIEGYRSSRINVKPNKKDASKPLSMGFGFVEFNNKTSAQKAMNALQVKKKKRMAKTDV